MDRTLLANERTLLSYVRTALTLIATGAGFLGFLNTFLSQVAGWAFIAVGLVTLPLGVWRFLTVRRHVYPRRSRDASS